MGVKKEKKIPTQANNTGWCSYSVYIGAIDINTFGDEVLRSLWDTTVRLTVQLRCSLMQHRYLILEVLRVSEQCEFPLLVLQSSSCSRHTLLESASCSCSLHLVHDTRLRSPWLRIHDKTDLNVFCFCSRVLPINSLVFKGYHTDGFCCKRQVCISMQSGSFTLKLSGRRKFQSPLSCILMLSCWESSRLYFWARWRIFNWPR